MSDERSQLGLFGAQGPGSPGVVGPAEVDDVLRDLAARLPEGLHLGTSSWSFPGWRGLVWDRSASRQDLARHGLSAYAEHPLLTTVGVDRTYYAPLPAQDFGAFAEQVPGGFSFLVKAHEALTVSRWPQHPRYGRDAGRDNPRFLDPEYARREVIEPFARGLGDRAGPLLFQFPPQDVAALGGPRGFADRMRAFLGALPEGPLYAVEIRNEALLGREYADALADHGAVHCVTVHPSMPAPTEQVERAGVLWGPALVARWMLHAGMTYEQARDRHAPFDRLVDPDPTTRAALAHLAREWAASGQPAWIIANNKAEGSSPRTLRHLAEEIVAGG